MNTVLFMLNWREGQGVVAAFILQSRLPYFFPSQILTSKSNRTFDTQKKVKESWGGSFLKDQEVIQ